MKKRYWIDPVLLVEVGEEKKKDNGQKCDAGFETCDIQVSVVNFSFWTFVTKNMCSQADGGGGVVMFCLSVCSGC